MGRGDIKSKKGKRTAGSFGNSRPHKVTKTVQKATMQKAAVEPVAAAPKPEKAAKK